MAYKNQKHILVPAGRWSLEGVTYGRDKCTCCGRPIRYLYHLRNEDHKAKARNDPGYQHPEEILIGMVCGPKVFAESCEGFYEDPEREWNRQYAAYKDYVNYIILNVRNKDVWELLPIELRKPIDDFLEFGYQKEAHSGPWWRMRDAKRRVLKSSRDLDGKPYARGMYSRVFGMVRVAKHLGIIPDAWSVDDKLQLNTHTQ